MPTSYKIPLYAISTGRNLAYGGSAPVYSGSVVLDLKRMNRVLEVSERNAFALVEPGVSYFDLYEHITKAGLDVWIDPPDPGWGSVIGNALDGGGGWTAYPFRDHFGSHCGMEVVLANGEVVRTGMGAVPNAKSWQQNKWGCGPWVDGLFRQGNMGIVTKMGFYLMPRPEAYMSANVQVMREEDIVPLMDTLNLLENQHVVNGSTSLFGGAIGGPRSGCRRAGVDSAAAHLRAREGDPGANGIREGEGREDSGRALHRRRSGAHAAFTRSRCSARAWSTSAFPTSPRSRCWAGLPRTRNRPAGTSASRPSFRAPARPCSNTSASIARTCPRSPVATTSGIIGPVFMTNWERSLVAMIMFPIGRDKARNAQMRAAFKTWVGLAAERGWAEYRAPAIFQDLISDTYSYNNHALRKLRETIKDAVDPNGILSPGRYGVWPKHLRKT